MKKCSTTGYEKALQVADMITFQEKISFFFNYSFFLQLLLNIAHSPLTHWQKLKIATKYVTTILMSKKLPSIPLNPNSNFEMLWRLNEPDLVWLFSRHVQSPGLLYKHLRHWLINSVGQPFPPTALQLCHTQKCWDSSSSYKIDYVIVIKKILNHEGHQNAICDSKVMAILLKWWTFPIGRVASGKVCACSLHSRLVLTQQWSRSGSHSVKKGPHKSSLCRHESISKLPFGVLMFSMFRVFLLLCSFWVYISSRNYNRTSSTNFKTFDTPSQK